MTSIPISEEGKDTEAGVIHRRLFSRTARLLSLFITGLCIVLAVGSTATSGETLTIRGLAGIASIGTVMIWVRSRYAPFVWSALSAILGLGVLLLGNSGPHGVFYWMARTVTALGLFWLAYLAFTIGKRLPTERQSQT